MAALPEAARAMWDAAVNWNRRQVLQKQTRTRPCRPLLSVCLGTVLIDQGLALLEECAAGRVVTSLSDPSLPRGHERRATQSLVNTMPTAPQCSPPIWTEWLKEAGTHLTRITPNRTLPDMSLHFAICHHLITAISEPGREFKEGPWPQNPIRSILDRKPLLTLGRTPQPGCLLKSPPYLLTIITWLSLGSTTEG
jgi:hypothetical protein